MSRSRFVPILVALLFAAPASAQLTATRITVGNAALLFGGTDADGGVDDWYVSNGVVEAIIDDAGPQQDLVALLGAAAPPRASEAAFSGGNLLDLGRVGEDNDQLSQMFTVGGLSTSNFVLYDAVGTSQTAGSASIVAQGELLGFNVAPANLPVTTEYRVTGADPFLEIITTVTNTHPTDTALTLGGLLDVYIWTIRALVPFSPLPGRGFSHVALDIANPVPALEQPAFVAAPGNVGPADGVIDPVTGRASGEVSYGLLGVEVIRDADGGGPAPPVVIPLDRLFGVNSGLVSALGNVPAGSLAPGATLSLRRRVYVGASNDVAGSANLMLPELAVRTGFDTGTVSGDLDAIDADGVAASVIATRTGGPVVPGFAAGAPISQFRTSPTDGTFSGVVLPVGTYDLEFRAAERDAVTVSGVVVTAAADTFVRPPPMTGLAVLDFQVTERAPGRPPIPARLTFVGVDGTPDPNFSKDVDAFLLDPAGGAPEDIEIETFAGGNAQRNFVYLEDGSGRVQVRPGRYEVYVSRGPEYTVDLRRVVAPAPRLRRGRLVVRPRLVRARLRRLVETPDAISADFHIHSARSFDASAPLEARVASFAGEGVEVMVSTEHDFVADYGPVIAGMGLGSHVTSLVGTEVTGSAPNPPGFANSIGHINAWPLPVVPEAPRDGAIEDEFVAPNVVFSRLRNLGAQVIQYNHPRAGVAGLTSIGFFTNIGYDPDVPIDAPPNDLLLDDDVTGSSGVSNPDGLRNIDFDAMEILNGTNVGGYLATRRDWFSLLNQVNLQTASGPVPFIAGTGVSDSHRITLETAGYGRSYVLGAGDDPATLSAGVFNAAVADGRLLATTGPYVELHVSDASGATAGFGELLSPSRSRVDLHVRVLATNWMPVDEVRIVQNGSVVQVFDATTSPAVRPPPARPWSQSRSRVVRFEADVPMVLDDDAWLLVEAGAALSPPPVPDPFVDRIVPGLVPLAFTNPVFVDLDGDGFDPPGLPAVAASAAAAPAALRSDGEDESPASMYEGLSQEEREEVRAHFPVHALRIPESAVAELAP